MGNTSRILQHLYSLNASSPYFLRYLHGLIQYDEEERYLTNLKDPELTRLLDFLDNALDVIPANDDVAQECLEKLKAICIDHRTLPPSIIVSDGELVRPGDSPIASEVVFDLWEGTYRDKEVHIFSLKTFMWSYKSLVDAAIQMKRLSHPNVVPFVGATTMPFQLIVERVSDSYLTEYLKEHPEANRIGLLLDVAEGLNCLHANNFFYDVFNRPYVIVDREGRARVTTLDIPWIVLSRNLMTKGADATLIAPGTRSEPYMIPAGNAFSFGKVVIEAFAGNPPSSQFAAPAITLNLSSGILPDRPQGAQKLGLTDPLWEMTLCCLHRDPVQRPNMTEVLELLCEMVVSSLSMEAGLRDFFEVCKTQGKDGRGEKAQGFADELDEALDNTGLRPEKQKQYLKYLRKLCSVFDLLPSSFLLPQGSVELEAIPFDSGGYSSVFKATFKERAVVVKTLNVAAQAEREKLHRLLVKEVVGWKWLRHQNVLPFVGVTFTSSTPISIVSEMMENGNITDFVRENQDYNRVKLLVGAATGLEYLHEHNIVHGDLKGVNILIDSQCRARLGDFGLATIVDESTTRTTTSVGRKQGTVRWMAPELLYPDIFDFTGRFEKQLPSKDTDIYAIGMTIFEVITGCVPFASVPRNETVMLKVVQGHRPSRPSSGLSEALWDLLVATWAEQFAQKPRKRPPIHTVLSRLGECVDHWGKSITPLIPEDWENIGGNGDLTTTASNFYHRISYPVVDEEVAWFGCSRTDFAILPSRLNRLAPAELFRRV